MPNMDINSLKEAIGDEKFATLQGYVTDLIGQRDTARNESISGRRKLKDDLAAAQAMATKAMEKLGVENADDLDALPDAKGQGEAIKQFQTKLSRAEREKADAVARAEAAETKYRGSLKKAAVAEALGGHEFIARDIVETFVDQRLVFEGDDLLFKSEDGKLIPIKDGVAGIAKTRPELLKPSGTGGAGVRQSNAGSGGGAKVMPAAQFEALSPKEKAATMAAGFTLTD